MTESSNEQFVQIMDKINGVTFGENMCPEWDNNGVGDPRVALFFKLVRGLSHKDLSILISDIINNTKLNKDVQVLTDIFVLTFQTRNCRGGKGEKDLFHYMLIELYKNFPETIINLIEYIPHFGYYKDFWLLIDKIYDMNLQSNYHSLIDSIYKFNAMKIIENDKELYRVEMHNKQEVEKHTIDNNHTPNIITPNLNLSAKYIPREGKKFAKKINSDSELCKYLFPEHF